MTSHNKRIGSVIMCEGDLSSVYRKRNRYEKGKVDKVQNVYYGPSYDYDVLCVVTPGEDFEIDHNESKGEFYKVYTASGIEGYVRKKNVRIGGDSDG